MHINAVMYAKLFTESQRYDFKTWFTLGALQKTVNRNLETTEFLEYV